MQSAQQQMEAVLNGTASYNDLSPSLKSAISIHVYFKASAILDLTPPERAKDGAELPEDIRDLVREECKRLLRYRGSDKRL